MSDNGNKAWLIFPVAVVALVAVAAYATGNAAKSRDSTSDDIDAMIAESEAFQQVLYLPNVMNCYRINDGELEKVNRIIELAAVRLGKARDPDLAAAIWRNRNVGLGETRCGALQLREARSALERRRERR